MDRDELAREIYDFHDYHGVFPGEAYKFNIKMPSVDLPPELREQIIPEEDVEQAIELEMQRRLTEHVQDLKQKFPWIDKWDQAGRMGGWLILEPDTPVLVIGHRRDGVAVPEVEPEDVKAARKRLRDLEKIKALTKEGIQALVSDLESDDFWVDQFPDYKPRRGGRKHWDPRKP